MKYIDKIKVFFGEIELYVLAVADVDAVAAVDELDVLDVLEVLLEDVLELLVPSSEFF